MKKKFILIIIVIGAVFIALIYGGFGNANAKLVENKTVTKQEGDFILHISIENADAGVKVYSSIQYVGDNPVIIEHRAPLVSISLDQQQHKYTGSPVSKELNKGNIYHPPYSNEFDIQNRPCASLYLEARFKVDDEEIRIQHVEELEFK
ncbi:MULTISPECIES: hypothetical protein [Virgibacillus]|uniref:Uncharacterized protein n=2 Tax=Virgibacillus TaxID=84406 RepID=A0A024QDK6_9BACI|nr:MULTISPECIES: hypothetical protein [Virgibacillus]EQB36598.1 hypothetical protein M948_16325 [Virgibacillus sp. CM-4]MYL42430.1 hypothetical protein [Virgibacillus massiliensis]GGJ42557.1 hypothetical protein GCM10007111_00870 [Virgibacillus kapii]CDQ40295.1 hypothetical protein BN990_02615 [Virgibacillus massiliensis]